MDNGFGIHLCPLPRNSLLPFDRALFFDSIITKDNHVDHSSELAREQFRDILDIEQIGYQIGRKPRRALHVPLLLPGWQERPQEQHVMLDLFRFVSTQKKPIPVMVHQETNKILKRKTTLLSLDSGTKIKPKQITTFVEFGSQRVSLKPSDIAAIKKESNALTKFASLALLGFKPIGSIPLWHNVDRSYFAYPSQDDSRKAFSALHHSMIRKNVCAIGNLLARATATSRLVAIFPQSEKREFLGDTDLTKQVTPPGLVVIPLPFEDDMRSVPDYHHLTPDHRVLQSAVELIQNQQMKHVEWGYTFVNPAMQEFWDYIESLAFNTPMPQTSLDDTKMDSAAILSSAGQQITSFRDALPHDEVTVKSTKTKERECIPDDSGIDWIHKYETNGLTSCTIPVLKKYLRAFGLLTSGRKMQLVDRIVDHIEVRIQNSKSTAEVKSAKVKTEV